MEKETLSGLAENLRSILKCGPYEKAITILNGEDSASKIKENPWEIVPIITQYIRRDVKHADLKLFETCLQLLYMITQKGYPDDILLLLIKDLEDTKDYIRILALLKMLGICLKAIPKKRLNYFSWSFNAIQKCLDRINFVDDTEVMDDDDDALSYGEYEIVVTNVAKRVLQFYGQFIDDFRICECMEQIECRDLLVRYILLLLGKPFAYLNTDSNSKFSKQICDIASTAVDYVTTLSPDVCEILTMKSNYTDDEYVKVNDLAIGVFCYFVFCEQKGVERIVKVYDNFYIFHCAFEYSLVMLKSDYDSLISKGSQLIGTLLNTIDQKLPYQLLDTKQHPDFCLGISNVIVYNGSENQRKESLKLFRRYVLAFETKGRYLIIFNLMQMLINKGFLGYLIMFYKDLTVEALEKEDTFYFSDRRLFNMLKLFCKFTYHSQSSFDADLPELSDKVISALNFVRFLFLRDTENRTGIWNYYDELNDTYFAKLQNNLAASRDMCKQRLNELQNDKNVETAKKKKSNFTVTVKGEQIAGAGNSNEETDSMRAVLTVLDVIESLLQRVQTIANEYFQKYRT